MTTPLRTIATSFVIAALTAAGLAASAAATPAPADNGTWGNPDIPIGSQARKEIQEGKRPRCTTRPSGNGASGTCVNNTDQTFYARISATCQRTAPDGSVSTTRPDAPITTPPHSTASASVRCPAGTHYTGNHLSGPVTAKEGKAMNENLIETAIKAFL